MLKMEMYAFIYHHHNKIIKKIIWHVQYAMCNNPQHVIKEETVGAKIKINFLIFYI